MNKSVKIILLVVAILLATGGVMAYYKTIVSPPGKLNFNNQYVISDNKDISKVKQSTESSLDSTFVAIIHEIEFQHANAFLTNQERNALMTSFANQYVPVFTSFCNSKFNKSVWNEADLQKINARVRDLQSLSTTDNKAVVEGENTTSLNEVHNVIVNYYLAKKASYVGGYNGLQSARQKIARARKFASLSPINNCQALLSRLNSVPARLEQAHYYYLAGQVERLRAYYNYSEIEYTNLALNISSKLEEYKNNARSVYGRASDISILESRAGTYYSNASF